jgi:hypothetical protein
MRMVLSILVLATLSSLLIGQDQQPTAPIPDTRAFREPFTLKLRVDKDHYYEEHYEKRISYVSGDDVYLFSGENFGVNLSFKGDDVAEVVYQPDFKKADVWFIFSQPKELAPAGMMLIIQNKLKRDLRMDALMTIPGKEGIYKTSIVPLGAGLSDYESWPHPIVQLVLRNFRVSDKDAGKPKK